MPGCCVRNCSNSSEKGFSMRCFPTNQERKALWIAKINIPDWKPSKYSRICEVHFPEEMWEKDRCDGTRRLKCNAVPINFSSSSNQPRNTDISLNQEREEINVDTLDGKGSSANDLQLSPIPSKDVDPSATISIEEEIEIQGNRNSNQLIEELRRKNEELTRTLENREKLYDKVLQRNERFRRVLKKNLRIVKGEMEKYEKLQTSLKKVFNKDQITWLMGSNKRRCTWSDETVKRAIRLKLACGSNGYQEILNQNIPLPSERTLRRKLEGVEFKELTNLI
ncbi:hypothetical protein DMN91_009148 [Ooceraea biroi]|uniref:THAP-type domain-containing protein n=1 Tax=Ooceraea biroi TaxID=2015173 RepID=A0A3L8DEP0_OOCBI|nr:THAP domain-containing protein 1-like [Ooceraea biroi]RLU18791.1 hypothetical protein DMN91_009148 [Ooceraea biroi]